MAEQPGGEINANEIVAKVIVEATSATIKGAAKPVIDKARRALNSITNAYAPYLEATFQRVRNIKTFLKPNERVDLLSVYVPVNLSFRDEIVSPEALVSAANSNGRIVVTGLAGRGKSILMRYVSLCMYHSPQGKIPLFLELRTLNNLTTREILQYVHHQYRGKSRATFDDFIIALDRGYFCLILDGFDELDPQHRSAVESQIIDLGQKHPALSILVSSRPDQRFQSWQDFDEYCVCPLTLDQARSLILQADYDTDVTKTFLKRLTPEFFSRHNSFLSTPLLIIMMMLTFEDYAEIPTSLHAFYKNAFDTLIRRHDATKPKFIRRTYSQCTAEQFQRIFSSFCILTYSKSKFEFSFDEVIRYLGAAVNQQQIDADVNQVLKDLVESICLLQQEGFEISFVHRSFQEYFCALFLSLSPAGIVRSFLQDGRFSSWDDMLPMLYGMARERVEQEWANDATDSICNRYSAKNVKEYICDFFGEWSIRKGEDGHAHVDWNENTLSRTSLILERLYPTIFIPEYKKSGSPRADWPKRLQDALITQESKGDVRLKGFSTGKLIVIEFSPEDAFFFDALGITEYYTHRLRATRKVRDDQRTRERSEDLFIKTIFDPDAL